MKFILSAHRLNLAEIINDCLHEKESVSIYRKRLVFFGLSILLLCLGPILFLIFVKVLLKTCKTLNVTNFANHTKNFGKIDARDKKVSIFD